MMNFEQEIKNMQDDVIRLYGFEAKETIFFCMLCEDEHFQFLDKVCAWISLLERKGVVK